MDPNFRQSPTTALKWLMTIKDATGRLARWAVYLQSYTFDTIHRQGSKHLNVDLLGRPVIEASHLKAEQPYDSYADINFIFFLGSETMQQDWSRKEEGRVLGLSKSYFMDRDGMCFKTQESEKKLLKVPRSEGRKLLVEQAHLLGHFQEKSTHGRPSEQYYWLESRD
jgi:hypothetical protein